MCIEQTIQNATIQAVAILAPELGNRLSDVLKSRYCKSNAAVLDCFLALVLQLNSCLANQTVYFNSAEGMNFVDAHLPVLLNFTRHEDWQARKAAVMSISVMLRATEQKGRLSYLH